MEHPMLGFLNERERFIPVQTPMLLERMLADPRLSAQERRDLAVLAEMLQARFHFEFLQMGQRVQDLYDAFNPDRDTLPLRQVSQADRDAQFEQLREGMEFFLTKSNYTKLTPAQLEACIRAKSRWGLAVQIDPRQYHEIHVYYRGVQQAERSECSWRTLWRPVPVPMWIFSRVAILVRQKNSKDGDIVLLKLFKEIVIEDLKMTWPNIRVLMRPVDRAMIAASALGGIFTPLWKLLVAVTLSPYVVATVVFGCLSAMVRAIWGFFSCKENYVKTLTHNLYYQNLGNNLSALARLIETAEAEELKEALLAYYLLYTERDRDYTAQQLDRRIEQWLAEQFSLPHVDFEIEDALSKLAAKGLAVVRQDGQYVAPSAQAGETELIRLGRSDSPSESLGPEATASEAFGSAKDGSKATGSEDQVSTGAEEGRMWKVYDLPTALRRLDRWWDERFPYHVPSGPDQPDRVADAAWPPGGLRRGE